MLVVVVVTAANAQDRFIPREWIIINKETGEKEVIYLRELTLQKTPRFKCDFAGGGSKGLEPNRIFRYYLFLLIETTIAIVARVQVRNSKCLHSKIRFYQGMMLNAYYLCI